MYDVVLQSFEYSCGGESQTHVSDLRSEILALDMTHMTILVETGSVELFEILRDTSIRILDLKNAECA
ncbi:hypothetical protein DPMN_139568 [Dreissena polymorpha]|nr:hypothetical protein DPMN_139495 [Dreissena polymorpha]KAH3811133.1 hypothetical protein DPMN_139538 [Dreissena polymorpha]KAH3811162.1 hypothetical protein DPMN_139568 [Dreissena polymorpha]